MGTYLNPGDSLFRKEVATDPYVDKTEMISCLNAVTITTDKCVCVTRPRGFGKTYAVDMVSAYYGRGDDSREVFGGLKLARTAPAKNGCGPLAWDAYLGKFDVIRLAMTEFFGEGMPFEEGLDRLQECVVSELKEAYPDVRLPEDGRLLRAVQRVYLATGRQFVVVIDDWDAIFRSTYYDEEDQERYTDFLRDLLKDQMHVALAYMTGILPIKKFGNGSGLNCFREFSMTDVSELAPYVGLTEDEVRDLCDRNGCDFDAVRKSCGGYKVRGVAPLPEGGGLRGAPPRYSLCRSQSVVEAVTTGKVTSHWNQTEPYEALDEYITKDLEGLKEKVALLMDGSSIKIRTFGFANDMTTFRRADDVLTLLVHLGCLAFDVDTSEARIPNCEAMEAFLEVTGGGDWQNAFKSLEASRELLEATLAMDTERVADLFGRACDRAGMVDFGGTDARDRAIRDAYFAVLAHHAEVSWFDWEGDFDVAYVPAPSHPEMPALVVRLRRGRDATTELSRIRNGRPVTFKQYTGDMLLVSISYDTDAPGHDRYSCVIDQA